MHERQIRLLQSRSPTVNVLTTHSAWLLSSLVLGCQGLLSGSGSVIADLQAGDHRLRSFRRQTPEALCEQQRQPV